MDIVNCTECRNALFNEVWGEYICCFSRQTIKGGLNRECKDFEKGTPQLSKNTYEYELSKGDQT